jgi:hypothetical protein
VIPDGELEVQAATGTDVEHDMDSRARSNAAKGHEKKEEEGNHLWQQD